MFFSHANKSLLIWKYNISKVVLVSKNNTNQLQAILNYILRIAWTIYLKSLTLN